MPDLGSSMNRGFHVLNGIIVVSFRGKERNVDLNGFYVFRKRELSIMDRILDFMCIKSI